MTEQKKNKKSLSRWLTESAFDWISAMVIAMLVLMVVFTFFLRVVGVEGTSMQPNLETDDRLLLWCFSDDYQPEDIVVINRYTAKPLVKRVIAVGGDTVRIDEEGHVFVNDQRITEPYARGLTVQRDTTEKVAIPEGYLFVMGDNRVVSLDSRSSEVGLISVKDVVGKTLLRIWPFDKITGVSDLR